MKGKTQNKNEKKYYMNQTEKKKQITKIIIQKTMQFDVETEEAKTKTHAHANIETHTYTHIYIYIRNSQ